MGGRGPRPGATGPRRGRRCWPSPRSPCRPGRGWTGRELADPVEVQLGPGPVRHGPAARPDRGAAPAAASAAPPPADGGGDGRRDRARGRAVPLDAARPRAAARARRARPGLVHRRLARPGRDRAAATRRGRLDNDALQPRPGRPGRHRVDLADPAARRHRAARGGARLPLAGRAPGRRRGRGRTRRRAARRGRAAWWPPSTRRTSSCAARPTRGRRCWRRTPRWPGSCPSGLARRGRGPRPSDTAGELLDHAVGAGLVSGAPARTLTELFREARFSEHPMGEQARTTARGLPRRGAQRADGPPWLTQPDEPATCVRRGRSAPASARRWSRSAIGVGALRCRRPARVGVGARGGRGRVALSRVPAAPEPRRPRRPGPPVENAPFRSYRQVAEALSWAEVSPRHYDLVTRPLLVRLLAVPARRPAPGRPRRPTRTPPAGWSATTSGTGSTRTARWPGRASRRASTWPP